MRAQNDLTGRIRGVRLSRPSNPPHSRGRPGGRSLGGVGSVLGAGLLTVLTSFVLLSSSPGGLGGATPAGAAPACYDGTVTVPANVDHVDIMANGEAGSAGGANGHGGGVGGLAEQVHAEYVAVTPGAVLYYGAASPTVSGGKSGNTEQGGTDTTPAGKGGERVVRLGRGA